MTPTQSKQFNQRTTLWTGQHSAVFSLTDGYIIRPFDGQDNRRWYFDRAADANDYAQYLERIGQV